MKRFRIYDGFSNYRTKKARYEHGEKMIKKYEDRLKAGWNPYENERASYEDNLKYSAIARVFQDARSGNKTFNYYSNQFLPEVDGMAKMNYCQRTGKREEQIRKQTRNCRNYTSIPGNKLVPSNNFHHKVTLFGNFYYFCPV